MKRKSFGMFLLLPVLLLSACSRGEKYEPFTSLSKVTVSPEREAAVQSALNGNLTLPTSVPVSLPTDEPFEAPSFDEDSFFAEVDQISRAVTIPTEPAPFEEPPTPTPLPPTATPVPTAVNAYGTNESGLTTYTLQAGEDLICLGRRFNISVSQLLSQNGLEDPADARTGDVITLPRTPSGWSAIDGYGNRMIARHPATYTVQYGDTIFSVACSYGDVYPEDIASRNGLTLGEALSAGMQLSIP